MKIRAVDCKCYNYLEDSCLMFPYWDDCGCSDCSYRNSGDAVLPDWEYLARRESVRKAEVPKKGYVCVVNESALYIFNFLGNYRYATKCDYGSAFSKHSEWIDGVSQGVATSFGKEQRDVRGDIMKELNRLSRHGRRC